MLIARRAFNLGLVSTTTLLALTRPSAATTVRALSLDELVERADRATLGTPVHHTSDWAYVAGSRRIVTWTRVAQERDLLSDEEEEGEILVMTLGGKVGSLRQKVPGEASLTLGERCLVFASSEESDGSRHVVGMAQGKYSIERVDSRERIRPSRELPHLIHPKRREVGGAPEKTAIEALGGKDVEEVRTMLRGRK